MREYLSTGKVGGRRMTNGSLSLCLYSVELDCPCRDAAGQHYLCGSWCRSPTGYFLLVEKVTKAPPRGKPLGYPHFLANARCFVLLRDRPSAVAVRRQMHLPLLRLPAHEPVKNRFSVCASDRHCCSLCGTALQHPSTRLPFFAVQWVLSANPAYTTPPLQDLPIGHGRS